MATKNNSFKMRSEIWLYPGEQASWHFLTLPKKQAQEIKNRFGKQSRGWGSLPVSITLGKTTWETSIFPDKKSGSYLLPLKAEVRQKEKIFVGDVVSFFCTIK